MAEDGQCPVVSASGPPAVVARLREIVQATREMVWRVDSSLEAVTLVRRMSAAERAINEILKHCALLEEEQFELRQEAAETHLRTQRRAGELLARLPKHAGGRPPKTASGRERVSAPVPTLRELGISQHESHRWQRIAAIPADVFERYLLVGRSRRSELTTGALLALARRLVQEEAEVAETDLRPSSQSALLREYEERWRFTRPLVALPTGELAAAMSAAQRSRTRSEIDRVLLWLTEYRDALRLRRLRKTG